MATKPAVTKIFDLVAKFLEEHKGAWDHTAWENLLSKVEKLGLEPDEALQRNLGNILESANFFAARMPVKKAATKDKAKPKAKAKVKAKSAAKSRAKAKPKSAT